ncbi:MAG: hypothetical protein ACKPEA_18175 [Planctomycetota bacterium]
MDPTAIALALGLEQAQASQAAPAPNAPAAATTPIRVQGQPIALPLSDRCSNAPLFQLEGEPVRLDLTAGAWLARLRGNVAFGPISTTQVDVNDAYGLDAYEGAFQGDLSLRWKNWVVRFTGSEFSTDATQAATAAGAFGTTAYALGDSLQSKFSFYSWGIDVQSWVWRPLSKQQFPWQAAVPDENLGGDLQILAIVGGRGFGVNQQVTNAATASSSTYDNTFGTVIVGGGVDLLVDLRGRVSFLDRLEFSATGTWGPAWPSDGCSETEIRATLTAWLCGNAGVFFGYRYTYLELADGDYRFSGDVAGLIVGGSLRW